MYILGISAFYHDSAAVCKDGHIVAAAEKRRFTRKSMMLVSILCHSILSERSKYIALKIESVVFYENPLLNLSVPGNLFSVCTKGFTSFAKSMPIWIKKNYFKTSFN